MKIIEKIIDRIADKTAKKLEARRAKRYVNAHCRLVVEGGQHFIVTPDGYRLPGIVWTRVYDGIDQAPHVIMKIYVTL